MCEVVDCDVAISQSNHQVVAVHVHLDNWREKFEDVEHSRVVQVTLEPVEPNLSREREREMIIKMQKNSEKVIN